VDFDGDSVALADDFSITIVDDKPFAAIAVNEQASVAVDETPLPDGPPSNDKAGSTFVTFNGVPLTSIASLFGGIPNVVPDPDVLALSLDSGALSFAQSTGPMVTASGDGFGADGPATSGATTFALTVTDPNSGLSLTDGTAITLSSDGSGRIIGTSGVDAVNPDLGGKVAFALTIDPLDGTVYMAQYLSLHQDSLSNTPNDPGTMLAGKIGATVTLKDFDGDTATSTAADISTQIHFLDDGPAANPVEKDVSGTGHDTNLMLILDVSGSMNGSAGVGLTGLSRLAVMKASVNELFEQYHDLGDVKVQLITFSDGATHVGTDWMTIAAAKTLVNGLGAGGFTNYDAPVVMAEAIFDDGIPLATAGVQNVSYFMSDGVPNRPTGSDINGPLAGMNSVEEGIWTTFLNDNSIDSFALGMGTGVTQAALDPLAFNGQTNTNTGSIVVTDLSQLTATLVGTVGNASGSLLTDGILPSNFGADGGYVKSITIPILGLDETYTYDPSGGGSVLFSTTTAGINHGAFNGVDNTETVTLASGGVLVIDMDDGTFTYTGPASPPPLLTETINFVLTDNDGDQAGSSLTINVSGGDHAPIVRDDHVITNQLAAAGNDVIVIPDYALLYNDSDPEGQTITVTGITTFNPVEATSVTHAPSSVTFTEESALAADGGTFTYTGTETTADFLADTGDVVLSRQTSTTLTGTGLGEILMGRDGVVNVINANEGNDVLIGGTGADTLVGGTGKDLMVGNGGADIFDFNATNESGHTIPTADVIGDFGNGADKIDLVTIDADTVAIGNQAFVFDINGAPLVDPGVVAHHVTWWETGGNTIVQLDNNGDTTADMMIVLTGIHPLTAANFNL
jgi:uncharacterized protein YegL